MENFTFLCCLLNKSCGFCCSFSLQELSRSRIQAHLELLCLETVPGRVGHQLYGQRWGWKGEKEEQISAGAVTDASSVFVLLSGLVCSIRNGCTALGLGEERVVVGGENGA